MLINISTKHAPKTFSKQPTELILLINHKLFLLSIKEVLTVCFLFIFAFENSN